MLVGKKKFLLRLAGILFACLVFASFLILLTKAGLNPVAVVAGEKKLRPIYRVDTEEKKVAISFDATWGAEYTDELLSILEQHQVKTTFFLVNIWLEKYPQVAKRIVAAGHELGLHSATHPHFSKLSAEKIREELLSNQKMIKDITGCDAYLFRPPFGDYNNTLIRVSEELGIKVIQWDVDSLDWKDITAEQIYNRVIRQVKPGSIVLFHNNAKNTPKAISPILEKLKAGGYQIVPVSDILLKGDTYVDANGIQRQKR
ncbi:MAG: polysaccharide deacetylase family protein [Bacillota bacterium]